MEQERQKLILARDFFGIKPLHYAKIGDNFVYGSEIKSIISFPTFEKKFNYKALDNYLSFQYVVPPETFLKACIVYFRVIICGIKTDKLPLKDILNLNFTLTRI